MCGVFGIHSTTRDVARLTYFGLFALQHRGQESAGIAVSDGGRITVVRDMGLVPQVFNSEEKLEALSGNVAIGHTRYSTTGGAHWSNAQPVLHEGARRRVALGHNGNLTNSAALRDELEADGVALGSTSDTEVIAALIAREEGTLVEAVVATMARLQGAFSVVCLSEGRLVAFRDAHGIRPLTLGTVGDDWVVASESCALDLVGARIERDVRAGEIVVLGPGGLASTFGLAPARPAACIFEHVYFARPDTRLNGQEVHRSRVRMGERLADEAPAEADLVMPIPDSGTPAAIGFAKRSGIPFEEGLIKNRYVGRTFIQPDQELRRQGIRLKFNPLDEIAGQRVVIVDDSIVRGNTMRQLVQMLFAGGAEEVHVRISSPQVVSPCFYGIDMAHEDDLVAAARPVEEVRRYIGATSLAHLSVEGMQWATKLPSKDVCRACFTGDYPAAVPDGLRADKLRFEPAGVTS